MDIQSEPIRVTKNRDGYKVSLIGSIHTNTSWVEGEFKKVIDAKPANVDLDLSETTHLSSWGVGLLVWIYNEVTKSGGTVAVSAIQKKVAQILHFARIDSLLKVESAKVIGA